MDEWSDAEQHVDRAHELYELGRWDEAETELREALSLNPYRAEWHFNLGLTLEAAGRYADAARAFQGADEVEPGDGQTQLMVGVNLLRADDARGALGWLERSSAADPKDPWPLVHRIEAYGRLGEHEQAELMFYLAQQLDPQNAEAYANLSESLLDRGMTDKAIWCLREAAQLDPELPRVHARLAEAYASTGRLERARQLYLLELRQDPGDVETLLDLGELLVEMNRLTEAGEKFRRALEMEPENPEAHFLLGELAIRQGVIEEARQQFDVVVRLDPSFPGGRRRLARLIIDHGTTAERARAHDLLEADLADFEQHPERASDRDLDELGALLLDANMPVEARLVFQTLARRLPREPRALHHMAVACFRMGDRATGTEMSRQALELDPKFVAAMHNMAVASVHQGQWMRARYWVRQALRVDGDDASLRRLRLKLRLHTLAEAVGWVAGGVAAVGRWVMRRRGPVGAGR